MRIAALDDYQRVIGQFHHWRRLPPGSEVTVFSDHLADVDALVDRLGAFDVVVAMRERTAFPRDLLARLPRLRLLVTTGGTNAAIDLQAARDLGIVVSATRHIISPPVELTWGLILALTRHIPAEDAGIRRGGWQHTVGTDLAGRTLGVVGLGRLGSRVAAIGRSFGMNVIAWSQNLRPGSADSLDVTVVSKEELFRGADVVTVHLRLSDRTHGIIGHRELQLMKPSAYLVNTSRGRIVDEGALLAALQHGELAGAGLDVFDREPLPDDHPLRTAPRTVLTPHIGYVTEANYDVFVGDVVEDILAHASGAPIRLLT